MYKLHSEYFYITLVNSVRCNNKTYLDFIYWLGKTVGGILPQESVFPHFTLSVWFSF